jgi:hypothetical protein|tara:strand:+ start:87 stop:392 length:306 start_codon:yes stop_codon:yes gene_type:complete
MAWFSLIKNLDFTRLEKEASEIYRLIEEYEMERDSAKEKLDGLLYKIGERILDGEFYADKDMRRMAENLQRKSGFDVEDFDELEMIMDEMLINEKLEADEE